MKTSLKKIGPALLTPLLLVLSAGISAQTLTVGDVHSYQVGDEFGILTKGAQGPDEISIEKIISRTDFGSDSVQFGKRVVTYAFDYTKRAWKKSVSTKHYTIKGLNNSHFVAFRQNDTLIRNYKDSSQQLISWYRLSEQDILDSCGTIVNERHDSNWTILSGESYSIVRAYKGLGVLMYFLDHHANYTSLIDQSFFYYRKNGVMCGDSTLPVDVNSGIAEARSARSIRLYPNPAQNMIWFNYQNDLKILIYDKAGKQLMNTDLAPGNGLDISHLSAGVYTVEIISDQAVITRLFVKS